MRRRTRQHEKDSPKKCNGRDQRAKNYDAQRHAGGRQRCDEARCRRCHRRGHAIEEHARQCRVMEGDHVGPFNLGNPGEFTMLELAQVTYTLPSPL